MEYVSDHGCQNGWLGFDAEYKPIPCLTCRPNCVKTAHINDCGQTDQPLRRHPVEDVWTQVVEEKYAENSIGLDLREMPRPTSLRDSALTVETASAQWAAVIKEQSEAIAARINHIAAHEVVASITVSLAASPTYVSRGPLLRS